MGYNERSCDIDRFAATLNELIGEIHMGCIDAGGKAVGKATRKAAKELRSGVYGNGGVHEWSPEYMGGFASHVEPGVVATGEVGNKAKPGLVHLLEKGHATLTGRRTRAYPHMAPAFESMQADFIDEYEKAVGKVLEG